MIRCSNCGWEGNPDGSAKCQRCNQLLTLHEDVHQQKSSVSVCDDLKLDVQKTVSEVQVCVNCGHSILEGSLFCSHCGNKVDETGVRSVASPGGKNNECAKTKVFDSKTLEESIQNIIPQNEESKQKPNNINSTVVEKSSFDTPFNGKATVADASIILEQVQKAAKETLRCDNEPAVSSSVAVAESAPSDICTGELFSYTLSTVDVEVEVASVQGISSKSREIKIESPFELSLKEGDLLLIGGLRFLVK